MRTAAEVENAFRAELQALLDKYGAEIEADDSGPEFHECDRDIRVEVTIPAIYDSAHNCIREWTSFNLGRCLWPAQTEPPSAASEG